MSAQRHVSEGQPGEAVVDGRGALNQFAPWKTRGRMEVTEVTGKGTRERLGGSTQGSLGKARQTAVRGDAPCSATRWPVGSRVG